MSKQEHQITQKGYEKLLKDLDYYKTVKRGEIADYMGKAIADGDLRESAAYDEARMLQSENEAKIAELEDLINRAIIVDLDNKGTVSIGAFVTVEFERTGKATSEEFEIVGTYEADIRKKKISDHSPLGVALLGKRKGETVLVRPSEKTEIKYKISGIRFE